MKHNPSSSMDWFSWLSKTTLDTSQVYEYGLVFARNELQFNDTAYFNHEFLQSMGISVAKHRLEILKLARKQNGGTPKSLSRLVWAISKTRKSLGKYFSKLVFHDHQEMSPKDFPDSAHSREYWKGVLLRRQRSEELKEDRPMFKTRSIALSGPLDGRVHERLMASNTRSLKLSGPLDGKMHDRLMYTNGSPRFTGTPDGRAVVPERLMITNNKSPKFYGPLDGSAHDRVLITNRNPKLSGPLDGRAASPKFCSPYEKEKEDDDFDDHSLWSTLFQDMKPT